MSAPSDLGDRNVGSSPSTADKQGPAPPPEPTEKPAAGAVGKQNRAGAPGDASPPVLPSEGCACWWPRTKPGSPTAVARGLRREGMAVDVTGDGADALYKARVHRHDVVVLDRDLPGLHGDDVCRA